VSTAQSFPRLSVNVDHVATLRQARRAAYPDPVDAARLAETAGASGITVHLRCDRRHIQDVDVARLRDAVRGKLNLEMSTAEEMVAIALRLEPDQVSLVPERPDEVTTEGGLDVRAHAGRVAEVTGLLQAAGVAVSVFLDPDPAQIEALAALTPRPHGFEINTDAYTRADSAAVAAELAKVSAAAALGRAHGLAVYAGHGLTTANVGAIAALSEIEELNIGHALIARAVLVGMIAAVDEMLVAMRQHG
jgi:pyridoxine 5-phosphate synthase